MIKDEATDKQSRADPASVDWETQNARAKAVKQCADWFTTDREAKSPYNAEMDEMYKLYKGDHWDLLDENGRPLRNSRQKQNHPNAVENVTFAMVEGLVSEFSDPKELVDYPVEESDEELALVMTDLKKFIAYKNRMDLEHVNFLRWFFLYGTGIWSKSWDQNWNGGKGPNRWNGEIRWKAEHPRSIFPDARCLNNFDDGRRLHKAVPRTIEDVEETWPEAKGIPADSISDDLVISSELEDSSWETSEEQVLVIDTWYKGTPLLLEGDEKDEGPGLHLIQWAGEGSLRYLSHANYVDFDPGEDAEFPIKGYKCYDRERSPWGIGEAYQIKNPQIVKNKTVELILEGHMHETLGQTWYSSDAVTEKQKKAIQERGSLPGMWFSVNDTEGIKRVHGKGAPASLQNEAGRLDKVMEMIVGRNDITQGKTPGSVTAFRALDLLNTRALVRLKSKDMTITASYEDCGNYINRLITRNYTDKRKYRILGENDDKPKWGKFDGQSAKRAYFFATDETMPADELEALLQGQEALPPEEQLVEGEHYEIYSPEFDTQCRLNSKMPTDRVFYMEMAKELFAGQLITPEIFFYVIEHGRFPPFEEILESLNEAKQQQAEQMQMQQMQQQPMQQPAINPEMEQHIMQFADWLTQNHPEVMQKLAGMPEEQRIPLITGLMQQMMESGEYPPTDQAAAGAENPADIKQQLIDIATSGQQK